MFEESLSILESSIEAGDGRKDLNISLVSFWSPTS